MKWSKYQRDIFKTYLEKDCNISIKAGPGCGKTTVLKQLCKLTPPSDRSIFLSFSKSIVEELRKGLPSSVAVSTLHSLGCRAIFRNFKGVRVSESKTFFYLKKLQVKWKEELSKESNINRYLFNLSNLYDLYRMNLLTEVGEELLQLSYRHSLDTSEMILRHLSVLIKSMAKLNRVNRTEYEIDFVDMIYLPVVYNLRLEKYDRVFLDEAQDLNICQHKLVDKLLKRTSRLISVGDENQCIYSFIGADPEAFTKISLRENTISLPLSETYRCPRSVVEMINSVFNSVEVDKDKEEGEVRDGSLDEVVAGDMVLCRNNKPLLQAYFKLLKQEKTSFIRGSDIGKGLVSLVSPFSTFSVRHCLEKLTISLENLYQSLSESGVSSPSKNRRYLRLQENIELVEIIGSRYRKMTELVPIIMEIFKETGTGVVLSTIHKAKGLESDSIFLLEPKLIPSKYATQDWEKEQEKRLLFVAYSRAKKKLIFIK